MLANAPVNAALDTVLRKAQMTEGPSLQIRDIEFYHTHFERGEAFSPGDLNYQFLHQKKIHDLLVSGGNYTSYAIPVQGDVLFQSTFQKPSDPRKEW